MLVRRRDPETDRHDIQKSRRWQFLATCTQILSNVEQELIDPHLEAFSLKKRAVAATVGVGRRSSDACPLSAR